MDFSNPMPNLNPGFNFNVTKIHSTFGQQMSDEQNLVIDLTTGFDSSRNSSKINSEDSSSRDSPPPSGISSRHQSLSETNDFSCQVNTIEDTDVEIDVDDISNDSNRK